MYNDVHHGFQPNGNKHIFSFLGISHAHLTNQNLTEVVIEYVIKSFLYSIFVLHFPHFLNKMLHKFLTIMHMRDRAVCYVVASANFFRVFLSIIKQFFNDD